MTSVRPFDIKGHSRLNSGLFTLAPCNATVRSLPSLPAWIMDRQGNASLYVSFHLKHAL